MSDRVVDLAAGGEPDAVLLGRFAARRDEAAFAELVRRHGPVVWGVCRRRLARREDAEDAFQATFLILAVKAGSIRRPAALAGWLHRTASRAAARVASVAPGEANVEAEAGGLDAFAELARREATAAVDEELVRLPGRYRDPIVLFHLEGLDRRQVADRLGVSEPTVKALLTRGRSLLRSRLARRGVALPLLLPLAVDPVPANAAAAACRLAVSLTRSGLTPFDLLSVPAKGLPMTGWLTNKAAAATLAGAACLTFLLVARGPANADGGKTAGGAVLETTLAQADPPEDEPKAAEAPATTVEEPPAEPKEPDHPMARRTPNWLEVTDSPAVERILAALDQETELVFPNVPLRNAIDFLGDVHDFSIIIDDEAIADVGVSIDDTVDITLTGITLRSGLDILLEPYGLTYFIDDEVMVVTTQRKAAREIDTRAYDLSSMLDEQGTAPEVAELVTQLLEPEPPTPITPPPGEGDASGLPTGPTPEPKIVPFRDRLLVTASWKDHRRIVEILRVIRVARVGAVK